MELWVGPSRYFRDVRLKELTNHISVGKNEYREKERVVYVCNILYFCC